MVSTVKLKVYICSIEPSTLGFVDKEGAEHACARAQLTAFTGLDRLAGMFGKRYLSDEDTKTLDKVEEFCRSNNLKYEVLDLGKMNFLQRLTLRMKGIKTPAICAEKIVLHGVPTEEDLKRLQTEAYTSY
jgi:hypothetical protein